MAPILNGEIGRSNRSEESISAFAWINVWLTYMAVAAMLLVLLSLCACCSRKKKSEARPISQKDEAEAEAEAEDSIISEFSPRLRKPASPGQKSERSQRSQRSQSSVRFEHLLPPEEIHKHYRRMEK